MKQEEMEMQLWEYIDGSCDAADSERISMLITTDATWKEQYTELISLQESIAGIDAEQPSLRFTKNVMDAVSNIQVAPATKKYLNINVIRGIAALFIIMIVAVLGYAVVISGGATASGSNSIGLNLSGVFKGNFLEAVICINIVLGLIILDKVLRRNFSTYN